VPKHHASKACELRGGKAARIVDVGTSWRWVVLFMLQSLHDPFPCAITTWTLPWDKFYWLSV